MKDICGNELAISDKVAATVSNYEELQVMYVHTFTPKGCRLSKTVGGDAYGVKFPHQVCKINNQENQQ